MPRGDAGWSSGRLTFGRVTTVLLGPNGSGKTPLVKALVYGLGHPVELPALVREKCASVVIDFAVEGAAYRLERRFVAGVDVTVTEPFGETSTITEERALSAWVLPKLGLPPRFLAGKNGDKVAPYISVVGPQFLVDQDIGWTNLYVPFETHQFVKDQREEVARWVLDVPARNRPTDRSEYDAAKVNLSAIQEQIAIKRSALESLLRELGEDRSIDSQARLEDRRATLEAELARAHSILESMARSESVLDVRVREMATQRDQIALKLANAKRRKAELVGVQAEVGAELGALEQNEVAADAFRALCGNQACQFFRNPEDSYGRRVLYLKDQLKDFEFSTGEAERELVMLHEQLAALEAALARAVEDNKRRLGQGDGGTAVAAVSVITSELTDVHVRLDRLRRVERERRQLEALLNRESRAVEETKELRPTGGPRRDSSRLLDARETLARTFKEWLDTLRTPNVPADASFDEELRLVVGGERFTAKSSHSGSTRTRIVLAYHAAMVETACLLKAPAPKLLVLDAPRQHELSAADLRAYIERFHALSAKQTEPVQLVFSATDEEVVPKHIVDTVWEPTFVVKEAFRFLGPVSDSSGRS